MDRSPSSISSATFRLGPSLLLLLLLLIGLRATHADWVANGVPMAVTLGGQRAPVAAPDGAGGAIVAWEDARSGFGDIYEQRVDAAGMR